MSDEHDERKSMTITGIVARDHAALAAYASVYNLSMGDAFARAVASLTEGLDGAERVIFDRILSAPRRKGRGRPRTKASSGEGGAP